MMITAKKERALGVILQYSQMALNIIIALVYTPLMLKILGPNEYGIYSLASSTISYLSLLSLGFGASYLRWYFIYKNKNDVNSINKLNGLFLTVFLIMGIISIILGMLLTANVSIFFNDTYSANEVNTAKILMFFLTINLSLSFPASVFTSYVTSQEKFMFQKLVNMGKTVVSPIANIIFLYLGFGSIGMVIVTTCLSLIVDTINVFFCIQKLKMKFNFYHLNFSLLKEIFIFSIFIGMNQIIDQINWQTDKVILGKFVNGTAVAVYAVGANLNTMFTSFSTAISGVFEPKVNEIVSKKESNMDEQLTNLFISIGRMQWFVMSLILSGFIFFGRYFILRWAGEEYINSYYVALLLMSPAIIPLIQNIGIEIQRAKNMHQFRSIIYLFMAFLNVGISIFLARKYGEIGAAAGTTISLLVANGLIMNIYYKKKIGIDVIKFWRSIISTFPGLIAPLTFGIVLMKFYSFKSFFDFILLAIIYSFIFTLSIFFLSMTKNERETIKGFISKVWRQ